MTKYNVTKNKISKGVIIMSLLLGFILVSSGYYIFKNQTGPISPAFGSITGRDPGGVKVLILTYHHLVPEEYNNPKNPYTVTRENFESQMRFLVEAGYNTISLKQYIDFLRGFDHLPSKPVIVTFDDGYASNYHLAFPVLKELGMKAVIFVVGAWVLDEDVPYAPEMMDFISWSQLKEMVEWGVFEVQSHTFDAHKRVGLGSTLTSRVKKECGSWESRTEFQERILQDLAKFRTVIEDILSHPVYAIAFPYGRYTAETLEIVRQEEYSLALTTKKGVNIGNVDPFTLKRIDILNKDSLEKFKRKLGEQPS